LYNYSHEYVVKEQALIVTLNEVFKLEDAASTELEGGAGEHSFRVSSFIGKHNRANTESSVAVLMLLEAVPASPAAASLTCFGQTCSVPFQKHSHIRVPELHTLHVDTLANLRGSCWPWHRSLFSVGYMFFLLILLALFLSVNHMKRNK
jgi:hypothetical protein